MKLAALYWFTIEFGLCRQNGELKVYGAGILGGVHEMEYCMTDVPKYYPLDPYEIAQNHVNFVINSVQPYYFIAESFVNAKEIITEYTKNIKQPFKLAYDARKNSVHLIEGNIKIKSLNQNDAHEGPLF